MQDDFCVYKGESCLTIFLLLFNKKFKNLKSGIEYVTRYCGRVPISENRIVNYDGSNVTFSYIDHKDNKYHKVTLPASEFIKTSITF